MKNGYLPFLFGFILGYILVSIELYLVVRKMRGQAVYMDVLFGN